MFWEEGEELVFWEEGEELMCFGRRERRINEGRGAESCGCVMSGLECE